MSVTRKIALMRQLEEMKLLAGEQRTELEQLRLGLSHLAAGAA